MSQKAKNLSEEFEDENDTKGLERFKGLALRYQEIGALYGIRIHPFRGADLPYLSQATPEERSKAADFLELILSIHEETLTATEAPINTRQLLWRALGRFSLVPGRDIFDHLTDEDVVILYDDQQRAIFWNLQFFKVSSFSVEELFFGQWFKFTKRDPSIQAKLYEMAVKIISGEITGNFIPDVPPHEVEEIDSIERIKTLMALPFGSVLKRESKFGGILLVQRMKVL